MMAGGPFNSFFNYLHDFVNPGGNNKIVIDRRTIEKTWKYMDKVGFTVLTLGLKMINSRSFLTRIYI